MAKAGWGGVGEDCASERDCSNKRQMDSGLRRQVSASLVTSVCVRVCVRVGDLEAGGRRGFSAILPRSMSKGSIG